MTSAGGEGKTTTEMRDVNTFLNAGWDFVGETANGTEDIWEMRANGADYPHLRWDSRRPVYLYSGGLGTEADPYKISTISDWRRLMNTSLHWNKYFIMMNDLDFKNSGIFIIGSDSTPFTGVFNGNGHIIRNVDINNPLFGSVGPSGQIRNLGVEDVNITGSGSLVGYNQGSITGCNVTGAVTGKDQVGGLVGSNGGTISNCYITGAITGGDGSGGLAGDNSGTITDCCAVVTVIGGNYSVGGLVGSNGGAIINCCAAGTVTGVLYVGGLAGANSGGVIIACYATGIVTGEDIVGGLVGYNYYGSVENCYAMGTSNGNENIGGLVGFDYYGNLTTCYAAGAVSGSSYIGGLTGDNAYNTTTACFWDVETTGQATSAAGTGKTTAEMKTLSTFTSAGWDFADIWGIGENQTYPFLRKYSLGDLNYDGIVNFVDFALFADGWFEGVQ